MARQFVAASSQKLAVLATPVTAYPFTMAAWVYADDVNAFYSVMHYGDKDVANIYWGIYLAGANTGDPVRIVSRNTTFYSNDTTTGFTAGVWFHVAGVWVSATERYVYINGGSKGGGTGQSSVLFSAAIDRLSIGVFDTSSPSGYLNGRVAEAAIWNTNLSDAQVAALAAGGLPYTVQGANLAGYWHLFGNSSPEPDYTANNNALTVTGATQVDHPTGLYGWKLSCVQGSHTLTGQAVALRADRKLSAVQGGYALAGQAMAPKAGRKLAADQGAYAFAGAEAALKADRRITAAQGSYSLSGQASGLIASRLLSAAQGALLLSGQDVSLVYTPVGGYTLVCSGGAFALTGQAINMLRGLRLVADSGSLALTGNPAGLIAGRTLSAQYGSFTLSGQAAGLVAAKILAVAQGSYSLTGFPIELAIGNRIFTVDESYRIPGMKRSYRLEGMNRSVLIAPLKRTYNLEGMSRSVRIPGMKRTYNVSRTN